MSKHRLDQQTTGLKRKLIFQVHQCPASDCADVNICIVSCFMWKGNSFNAFWRVTQCKHNFVYKKVQQGTFRIPLMITAPGDSTEASPPTVLVLYSFSLTLWAPGADISCLKRLKTILSFIPTATFAQLCFISYSTLSLNISTTFAPACCVSIPFLLFSLCFFTGAVNIKTSFYTVV